MQSYLKSQELIIVEKQNLFMLRRNSYSLKSWQKTRFSNNMYCRVCLHDQSIEDEIHTFEVCKKLVDPKMHNIKFVQIYSSLEEQINAIKYFSRIIIKRDIFLEIQNVNV